MCIDDDTDRSIFVYGLNVTFYTCAVYLYLHRAVHIYFFLFFSILKHASTFSRSNLNRRGRKKERKKIRAIALYFRFPFLYIRIVSVVLYVLSTTGNKSEIPVHPHINYYLCNFNNSNCVACTLVPHTLYDW